METWLAIKYTAIGKLGALCISSAPVVLAMEMANHIDALIAAVPPTLAVIVGVIALARGQKQLHVSVDGRMKQLLEVSEKIARSEGKEEGAAEVLELTKNVAKAQGKEEERFEERIRQTPPPLK